MTNIILHQDVCSNWQWLNPEKSLNRFAAGRSLCTQHTTHIERNKKIQWNWNYAPLTKSSMETFAILHWLLLMSNIFWEIPPKINLFRLHFNEAFHNFVAHIQFCSVLYLFFFSSLFSSDFYTFNFSLTALMGTHLWKSFKGHRTMNVPHQCHRRHLLRRNNTPGTTVDLLCLGERMGKKREMKFGFGFGFSFRFVWIIIIIIFCVYINVLTFNVYVFVHRDTSSPITPLKPLDSPLLYGYKSANHSESNSSNSSGNSPNNTSNSENLNLIDLIVSTHQVTDTLKRFFSIQNDPIIHLHIFQFVYCLQIWISAFCLCENVIKTIDLNLVLSLNSLFFCLSLLFCSVFSVK